MTGRAEMLKLIRQVHLGFIKYFSRKFASSRLTHPQHMLLVILIEEGAQKMSSLAESLHISTPAVTNLVDKLERSGYARRIPHKSDRRAHVIELTPHGKRFVGALRGESLSLLADTIGNLPASDRRAVVKFYRCLLARLDEALAREGNKNPKPPPSPGPRGPASRKSQIPNPKSQ